MIIISKRGSKTYQDRVLVNGRFKRINIELEVGGERNFNEFNAEVITRLFDGRMYSDRGQSE